MGSDVINNRDLQRLRAEHPGWSVWWTEANNSWWAVPLWDGAPFELVETSTLGELDEHMRFLERRRKE